MFCWMQSKDSLYKTLDRIDGRGYKAYRDLQNQWYDFGGYSLGVPYVQGDPYARPSKVFLRVAADEATFPGWILEKRIRVLAAEDYVTRLLSEVIKRKVKGHRGSGKSGLIQVAGTGQEVIETTSVQLDQKGLEARLMLGLPAKGRRVRGYQAQEMFFEELPQLVKFSLRHDNLNQRELEGHIRVVEDQCYLRQRLADQGLVAFVGNGSILPRRSGVDDRPLDRQQSVPFTSPPELEVEFNLPHRGRVKGMGVREGVTLIVGGGYHGKSTLLEALERGVYNHIPGDGRELVVTRSDAFKIRAEDGRRVERVDISPFINNLPRGEETNNFCSENASGSTSQAANIMEALELGAGLLLIDEDTCATNFMVRDVRMQQLVVKAKEPITPFIDKVRLLKEDQGVSTVLVVGGAGDYFDVADMVVMMDEYLPCEVTGKVREITKKYPSQRREEGGRIFGSPGHRIPVPGSINPRGGKKVKVRPRGLQRLQFGRDDIDLGGLEQLVSKGQTRAIGDMIVYALKNKVIDGRRSLKEILDYLEEQLDNHGLEVISPFNSPEGNYHRPRSLEVGAALNRLRSLKIKE